MNMAAMVVNSRKKVWKKKEGKTFSTRAYADRASPINKPDGKKEYIER